MKPKNPREVVDKDLKTKTVYICIDDRTNLKVKSREVYKNKKLTIHYPFRRDGAPKYGNIKRIVFEDMPDELQRGFFKDFRLGYGFTRIYSRLVYKLIEDRGVQEILVSPTKPNSTSGKQIVLNSKALDREYPKLKALLDRQSKEQEVQANQSLCSLYPADFKAPSQKYVGGGLQTYIAQNNITASVLSDADVSALLDLTRQTGKDNLLTNEDFVLKTKEHIEEFYIETVIEEFEKLLAQKTSSAALEEKWQSFFKKYSWIFSQLFSFPVLMFEDKAYMGGKDIKNQDGKIADFLYQNELTQNVAIIEIKTHRTALLKKQSYRGSDVYAADKELTGGINQVLDQRDNLQKEFYALQSKSKNSFRAYNPECIVVAGMIRNLTEEQQKSFELLRSNSKDVEILTYDEVLHRLKSLQKLMTGKIVKTDEPKRT